MKKLLLLIALLNAQGVYAAYISGNQLLEMCSADLQDTANANRYMEAGGCRGYITGTVDIYETFDEWNALKYRYWCVPDAVDLGQLRAVVLEYLKENPETLHQSASALIVLAYTKAFPCQ